ncbi:MAG: biotin--[acetyl-CoA-carboxylase] ligase [Xanthobacteraceae bacterium]|nr:biotin--[acetyl-CoA-carboxylase] ligase [Xanthobacteraceae bacterium]
MTVFPAVAGALPVAHFSEIGSTNAEALARAAANTPEQWIVADRQIAGRGRRGRQWVSEPGNLYSTLLLYDPAPPALSPQICFVAALALHDAVCDALPTLDPQYLHLKWPNDLLLAGKKLAGILVEGASAGARQAVVTGTGVNCVHHPVDTAYPVTDFAAEGFSLTPQALFEKLAARMMDRLTLWRGGRGFNAIRNAWLARAHDLGRQIEVKLAERVLNGRFDEIDSEGALVLSLPGGHRELIRAGDIFPAAAK